MELRIEADPRRAGSTAGQLAADVLRRCIDERGTARVVFASAPSQEGMLAALRESGVDLHRIRAFHLDEYIGIDPEHPAGFGKWLADRLGPGPGLDRLDPLADVDAEIGRYAALLDEAPIDLALVGIGVNGHLAFNEPYDVPEPGVLVRDVELTHASRQQQVDDECFASLDEVPTRAFSLTPEAILRARTIVCTAVGERKAEAARATVKGPVTDACPASILQTHDDVVMVLDADAAGLLEREG